MECEKLAQEKTEMQRHYVMVSDCLVMHEIDRIIEIALIMNYECNLIDAILVIRIISMCIFICIHLSLKLLHFIMCNLYP